jgi:L-serine dehydratase
VSLSALDLFTIGIGPSSSHTIGPMRAARRFALALEGEPGLEAAARVRAELFGSLGATGKGHGTDTAILLGLEGAEPEAIDPDAIPRRVERIRSEGTLRLLGRHAIAFALGSDVVFHALRSLPAHSNGMTFVAYHASGAEVLRRTYYSIGGGFVACDTANSPSGLGPAELPVPSTGREAVPNPFRSAGELLARCVARGASISTLMMENERTWRSEQEVRDRLLQVWTAMRACVRRGFKQEGVLPGGLGVRRRAAALHRRLLAGARSSDPLVALDWVNLWALAVNEENAAGGRVVTAPTNGAAGVIPAVLHYYERYAPGANAQGIERFLLVAGAIGVLYKTNASISGAEVGCQGEVGVACSMAAAGLTEALGGTPQQVENAAEIGMEHNLGLTCDPIGGLVQVPCIERNAMGAVKAVNASRIALSGDGEHRVSLDKVIATMRATGADMLTQYKETALGGLAVNVVEC